MSASIEFFAKIQAKAQEGMDGEVKMLVRMETDAARTVYLEQVAETRGRTSSQELRRRVWAYMQANGIKPNDSEQAGLFA